ncbi:serine--tRNA ligase [Gammaproteobacteria bacterium]|jgi:seryl-tRNA synthetase|nr:serine--tRNA ligase [Gammaproteobacteria bacterium]MDA9143364.1 serine--tRNA ligase [Gammaproteobacteria bacterium]MDC3301682.1 serine--tRNA ligase [Gammaproteobacteria bacterium]
MIDIKKLRDDAKNTQNSLLKRGYKLNIEEFISLDSARKDLQISVEDLQSQRKELSAEFGKLKSSGGHTGNLKEEIDAINANLKSKDDILQNLLGSINNFMLDIPNIPREDVPVGSSEIDNIVVSKYGEIKTKTSPDHLSITSDIDTDSAANIAGSRFSVLKGDLSKLQRSLIHFMLEVATKNGYEEYYVPFMANKESLKGTGQLPKFEEDLFKASDNLYLIPTAEVPLTNLFRNALILEDDLPKKVTSHTPCFRSEAGSYGRDTKGLIRQHQFEKIELVQITNPETSLDDLNSLLGNAEEILQLLDLPYQVIELCTGDLGFSSSKTFDIEVWMPSQGKFREISSCSNFSDFQARRSNIKIKTDAGKLLAHTINGSALAVGRTLVAIVENNFNKEENCIEIPDVLRIFMGKDKISL